MASADGFFASVKKSPEKYYIIHYSSEGLSDNLVGHTPKITSIVIQHYSTRQVVSFTIHTIAEELKIPYEEIFQRYDEIETVLLERFYNFIRERRANYWIHWNMRNLIYGFEHIDHRYRLLTAKEPPQLLIETRFNLNDMLEEKYGSSYAEPPRMKNLMLLNGSIPRDFLEGKEEAEAFKKGEFIKMNSSTICKVEYYRWTIGRVHSGKLKTAGDSIGHFIDTLLSSRRARVLSFFGSCLGIIVTLTTLFLKFVYSPW